MDHLAQSTIGLVKIVTDSSSDRQREKNLTDLLRKFENQRQLLAMIGDDLKTLEELNDSCPNKELKERIPAIVNKIREFRQIFDINNGDHQEIVDKANKI